MRVERATALAMQRAMAEVLYASGLTVQLRPGERERPQAPYVLVPLS
ncbi:hypothetical protein [Nonomuraea basaltis]|nr:hypothetical protein [Nonomuraea basaltis]